MPTPAFRGRTGAAIFANRITSITVATDGFPFVNASGSHESFEVGLREASKLAMKEVEGTKDGTERSMPAGWELSGSVPLLQTDLASFHNIYLASTDPCQMLVKFANGKYGNFTKNAAGLSAPDGSSLAGFLWKFSMDSKKRVIEIMPTAFLFPQEFDWFENHLDAAETGGTGGTTKGLTAMPGYDRSKYRVGNVADVMIGGHSVGWIKDDFKLEVTAGGNKLNPGVQALEWIDLKCDLSLRQMAKEEMLALNYFSQNDAVIEIPAAGGETIKIHNPGMLGEVNYDEKEMLTKVSISARYYKNADEATPNSIDIGVTDADTLEFLGQW